MSSEQEGSYVDGNAIKTALGDLVLQTIQLQIVIDKQQQEIVVLKQQLVDQRMQAQDNLG